MSKEARALLEELLLSGIDAAGLHCTRKPDDDEDEPEPDDEPKPDEPERYETQFC